MCLQAGQKCSRRLHLRPGARAIIRIGARDLVNDRKTGVGRCAVARVNPPGNRCGEPDRSHVTDPLEGLAEAACGRREIRTGNQDKATAICKPGECGQHMIPHGTLVSPLNARRGRKGRVHQDDRGHAGRVEPIVDGACVMTGHQALWKKEREEVSTQGIELVEMKACARKGRMDRQQTGSGRGFQHDIACFDLRSDRDHRCQGQRRGELLQLLRAFAASGVGWREVCDPVKETNKRRG